MFKWTSTPSSFAICSFISAPSSTSAHTQHITSIWVIIWHYLNNLMLKRYIRIHTFIPWLQYYEWQEYRVCARLPGSAGPINCLAFTQDGKFLASGGKCRQLIIEYHWQGVGDDEKLHIWDIDGKRPYQVISDELERWGQITCVKWLPGISNNGEVLCFGTGRGLVLIYHQLKEAVWIYNKIKGKYSHSNRTVSRNYQILVSCLSTSPLNLWTMMETIRGSRCPAILARLRFFI